MEDTYHFDEQTEKAEGMEAMDDIEAFERRLRGEAPPAKAAAPAPVRAKVGSARRLTAMRGTRRPDRSAWQENKPKPANGKKGSAYVQAAVKAPKMTEAQQEAADARSAVADLAKFEQRGFGGR